MDIFKMFNLLEKVERAFSALYKHLQEKYRGDEKAERFFYDLHMEEESHVQLVLMERRIVQASPKEFSEPSVNLSEINNIFEKIADLQNNELKLPELIRQVYILEKSSSEKYVIEAMKDTNEEIKEFLTNLGGTFDVHRSRLVDFAQEMGVPVEDIEDTPERKPRIGYTEGVLINGAIAVRGVDISEGGMFLLTGRSFAIGDIVSLRFKMHLVEVSTKAVVQFNIPATGMGVRFTDLATSDRELIKKYIAQRIEEKGSEKVRRVLFVGNAVQNARENTRMYMNNLIIAGYRVMDISGFDETVSALKKGLDLICVVISIESDMDTNYSIFQYISTQERYRNIPALVLTNSQDKRFREKLAGRKRIKLLSRITTSPKNLTDEIKALTE